MTKTFTFGNDNFNNSINYSFLGNTSSTNYSKVLDDIILADIIDKNDYLFKKHKDDYLDDILINAKPTKKSFDTEFSKAANFLANYKKLKKSYKIPFKLNTTYTLSDGTPIIFYDDEVQIGFDVYKYANFSDLSFINTLTPKYKDIIINIYTKGAVNININIL